MQSAMNQTEHNCNVCKVSCSTAEQLQQHLSGKRHRLNVSIAEERREAAARSIFVGNLPSGTMPADVEAQLESHGIKVKTVIIDPRKAHYAIAELGSPSFVDRSLELNLILKEQPLKIKRRELNLSEPVLKSRPKQHARKKKGANLPDGQSDCQADSSWPAPKPWVFPALQPVLNASSSAEHLDSGALARKLEIIHSSLAPTADDMAQRDRVKAAVAVAIRKTSHKWNSADLVEYGSVAAGLGRRSSDLDLTIVPNTAQSEEVDPTKLLAALLNTLRLDEHFESCTMVRQSRCPVVKARHKATGLEIDVSLSNRLALRNTQLLKEYCRVFPRLPQLGRLTAHFARSRGFHMSSYAINLLLISILQKTGHLPNLQAIAIVSQQQVDQGSSNGCQTCDICRQAAEDAAQHSAKRRKTASIAAFETLSSWDCSFCPHQSESIAASQSSLGELWINICRQLAELSGDVMYSVRLGGPVSKDRSHSDMKSSALMVEDPFELDHNIGHGIDHLTLEKLRNCALEACFVAYSAEQLPFEALMNLPHALYRIKKVKAGTDMVQLVAAIKYLLRDLGFSASTCSQTSVSTLLRFAGHLLNRRERRQMASGDATSPDVDGNASGGTGAAAASDTQTLVGTLSFALSQSAEDQQHPSLTVVMMASDMNEREQLLRLHAVFKAKLGRMVEETAAATS